MTQPPEPPATTELSKNLGELKSDAPAEQADLAHDIRQALLYHTGVEVGPGLEAEAVRRALAPGVPDEQGGEREKIARVIGAQKGHPAPWSEDYALADAILAALQAAPAVNPSIITASEPLMPWDVATLTGYQFEPADPVSGVGEVDTICAGASDLSCYLYPGRNDQKLREAFVAGVAHQATSADLAEYRRGEAEAELDTVRGAVIKALEARKANDRVSIASAAESALDELVRVKHWGESSFINLPLIYPDGSHVTVKLDLVEGGVRVSDNGFGYRLLENIGAERSFPRSARKAAEVEELCVDKRSIFVDVPMHAVTRAICDVSVASWNVVDRVYGRIADQESDEIEDHLRARLSTIFAGRFVPDVHNVRGLSTTDWEVSAVVKTEHVQSDAPAAEYRQALVDFNNMRDDGTIADAPAEQGDLMGTHSAGCWSFGPRHYECALNEIKRLAAVQAALADPVAGEREAVKQAIHDWVREDAPINQKMTWTPALNTALENRILASHAEQAADLAEYRRGEAEAELDTVRGAVIKALEARKAIYVTKRDNKNPFANDTRTEWELFDFGVAAFSLAIMEARQALSPGEE